MVKASWIGPPVRVVRLDSFGEPGAVAVWSLDPSRPLDPGQDPGALRLICPPCTVRLYVLGGWPPAAVVDMAWRPHWVFVPMTGARRGLYGLLAAGA